MVCGAAFFMGHPLATTRYTRKQLLHMRRLTVAGVVSGFPHSRHSLAALGFGAFFGGLLYCARLTRHTTRTAPIRRCCTGWSPG